MLKYRKKNGKDTGIFMRNTKPRAGIYTLGCKVNQYESEAIAEKLTDAGFLVLPPQEICDVYIVNTCTVTGESDRKARQLIRRAIHQNPDAYILVTGCFSQVSPESVAKITGVDFVCGNAEKQKVVEKAKELIRSGYKPSVPEILPEQPDACGFEPMQITSFDRTRAYVKIEDGCENRCTYCIIPAARGRVRSKEPREVLEEVRGLTAGGCREIVLTGIETASYGRDLDGCDLADLLTMIDRIPGIGRVRLGSLDPSLMRQSFVDRIASLGSLTPHFHLSLQSGSDTVLARMKRKYNAKMALEGMERLRRAIPGVQFTTDVIVGFPGESEEEFAETLSFIRQAEFLHIHIFPYSRRKGTVAAQMNDQIPEEIKRRREKILSAEQAAIQSRILDRMNGRETTVLFETFQSGTAYGHTPDFLEVACPSPEPLHARILPVRIGSHDGPICFGTILTKEKS